MALRVFESLGLMRPADTPSVLSALMQRLS